MTWLLLPFALALTPEQVDERIRSVDNLSVAPDLYRRVEEPIVFEEGALRVRLEGGVMVPVFSGRFAGEWEARAGALLRKLRAQDADATLPDAGQRGTRELVGFVWMNGDARVRMDLGERGDALRHASRQVLLGGEDRDAMAAVARGDQDYETAAHRGVFLSSDPRLDELFLGEPDGDPYAVVVYPDPDSLAGAADLLARRLETWEALGYDWSERIARDRVAAELGQRSEPATLVDLETQTRFHHVSMLPKGSEDRWLSLVSDDLGVYSPRWKSAVMSTGRQPNGKAVAARMAGVPFPDADPGDPDRGPLPTGGVAPVKARSLVTVKATDNGLDLQVRHHLELELRARSDVALVDLQLPRVEAVPNSFELLSVTADGVDAVSDDQIGRTNARVVKKVRVRDGKGGEVEFEDIDGSRVRLVLPELLAAGESTVVVVQWMDTWPYAATGGCLPTGDAGSGAQRFMPELYGHPRGGPWDVQVTVGVPAKSKLEVVVSGDTLGSWEENGWRLTRTERMPTARWPSITVGKYHVQALDAVGSAPAVDVYMFHRYPQQLESPGPEAHRMVGVLSGYLPDFPVGELDYVEPPVACRPPSLLPSPGVAWLTAAAVPFAGPKRPLNAAHRLPAQSVVRQYFGQLVHPASPDDAWILETFSEIYVCRYFEHVLEQPGFCANIVDGLGQRLSKPLDDPRRTHSLSESYTTRDLRSAQHYGMVVFDAMLRPRIGDEAFFAAIEGILRVHGHQPLTTERLQHAFELASDRDLTDFFDFWVHQGLVPKLRLEIEPMPGGSRGVLRSDVPFGTFDLEVRIEDDVKSERRWVRVVDGVGRFDIEGFEEARVVLDPDHTTLLRGR